MERLIVSAFENKGYIYGIHKDSCLINEIIKCIQDVANVEDLSLLHKTVSRDDINEIRILSFEKLNNIPNIIERLYGSVSESLLSLMGNDILGQNRLNLSIQMPNDVNSQLNLHTDTISGQSEYEVVLWTPLTRAYQSNSIYIFEKDLSFDIYANLSKYERIGNTGLYERFKDKAQFIEVEPPNYLMFSSTLLHGNVINHTNSTRVSFNYRYKPTYSKKEINVPNERKFGTFYVPVSLSPITKLVMDYKEPSNFK